jgi:hypothetical protein
LLFSCGSQLEPARARARPRSLAINIFYMLSAFDIFHSPARLAACIAITAAHCFLPLRYRKDALLKPLSDDK